MARVILRPLGSPLDREDEKVNRNQSLVEGLDERLTSLRDKIAQGWGQKYTDRVHKKGKLTTWERIERLRDPGTAVRTVGTFVNHGEEFEGGRQSPAAGVITAFVQVEGRHVVVIANDNTVASGSWWPRTPEKIQRAQEIALRLKVPVVYLVDCSGLFLPEQGRTFPGKRGAGHIFKMNSLLSDAGVPQLSGVFGDCIAGGGYMPLISDKVFMTEQAYMVIAGAALIKGAKSQSITSLSIGGPNVHVHLSHCADDRAPDDEVCLEMIRREVASLPSSAVGYYRYGAEAADPAFEHSELEGLVPVEPGARYDVRQVIARLVDQSLFWELGAGLGQEMITGVARISGLYVGIIANNQDLVAHPEKPGRQRPGGILYKEGIAKVASFSRACNDDGLPILWLQDISGFDIGQEAEKQGLLGYGSSLIYTNSTNTTPMITVLLRKASGAGYYAMAGHPYDPVLQLSTPLTRLAVMEGRTLAIGAFNARLDDQFNIATEDPEERARVQAGMKAVEEKIEGDMDPIKAASQMDTDEVVRLRELRGYLEDVVQMCYQASGVRRIKNPRIWSMHDLQVMWQEGQG
jgi:acetyl-CoA carboxylase carboxyltransferase component